MDTTELQTFFEGAKEMEREALKDALDSKPKDFQNAYWKMRKAAHFAPENEHPESRKEIISPSGKFKLVISHFSTGPGSWDYSQGKMFRQGSDDPIAVVQRNYGAFPFLFVEDHPKGNFLVCGEDYQGQTVVELDTGARRDNLSEGTNQGFGFCWAEHRFDVATEMLMVCGCHWACPYEFRLYDFSDPMNGWPEIESPECLYEDSKWPEIAADGTLRWFQTNGGNDDEEDEEGKPKRPPIEKSITTLKREGLKFVVVSEWVSEAEKADRLAREESERKYEAWKEEFKANDPLYLAYAELVKDPALSPEDHMGIGITYENWCPHFKGEERRWCRRIVTRGDATYGKKGSATIDLEWAVVTGPIKLVIYKDGKHVEDRFFEHSVAAMNEAFAYAKSVLP